MAEKRVYIVATLVDNRKEHSVELQKALSEFTHVFICRQGCPYPDGKHGLMTYIAEATEEELQNLLAKLNTTSGVRAEAWPVGVAPAAYRP